MKPLFQHIRGYLGTGIFHLTLVLLLVLLGFKTPLPLPAEEGILINFGTEDQGSGLIEPSESNSSLEESTPPASIPDPAESAPSNEENILTQDLEETVALPSSETKDKVEPDPKEIEAERKRQAELERQRQEELERKRQEELERKRIEEEQKRIKEIADRTKNAFTGGKNQTDNTSQGEGITSTEGNQGKTTGSVNSTNYSGTGTGDEGVSYSLSGRVPLGLPLPEYNYQVEGIVVVEVTVDRNGIVTKATPGVKGSTTLDENLLKAANDAALSARFDKKPDAPAFQKGTITYHFMLR
ncbi:MAG: hypothetical protein U9N53_09420 [Bacteroidota bacterium]|nr:hypothetical protein [Bacteroidota bacterium]